MSIDFYSESCPSVTAVDQDGYLAPITPQFLLSDPPMGHSTTTDPSSAILTSNTSVPGNLLRQDPAHQYASNPVYSLGLNSPTRDIQITPEGTDNSRLPQSSQIRDSRLKGIGCADPSDTSAPSFAVKSVNPDMTTTVHSGSTSSPLSPTGQSLYAVTETIYY